MSETLRQKEIDIVKSKLSIQDQAMVDSEIKSLEELSIERQKAEYVEGKENRAERATEIPNPTLSELDFMILDKNIRRVSDFIGLSTDEMTGSGEKIEFLMEWARSKSQSNDIGDIVYEIKKLRDTLGFQEIGKSALDKLYQYINLSEEESSLSKRLNVISKEKEILTDAGTHR